jgi:transposase
MAGHEKSDSNIRKSRYQKIVPEGNRCNWRKGIRRGFDRSGNVICQGCFKKDLIIDELKIKINNLQEKMKKRQKRELMQGAFGSSTPSSQKPIKENALEEDQFKNGGAKVGHKGKGRTAAKESESSKVVELEKPLKCPDCEVVLYETDARERTVVDVSAVKAKRILYKCNRGKCPRCFRTFSSSPDVLPKCLYGNQLIAQAAVMHYFHGIPLGRIIKLFGQEVTEGGLIQAFHRLGKFCEKALPELIKNYRESWVKHADETGWRTDGRGGYAWVFCSENTTIFLHGENRSAEVAHRILGNEALKGYLVVDRYKAYSKVRCQIQYCYSHLLRAVEDLKEEFEDRAEVVHFSEQLASLVGMAISLRRMPMTDQEYYVQARSLKKHIQEMAHQNLSHLGIQSVQNIFLENESRLYHWVEDRRVPADNNAAEREVRPTVVARKSSFGSQSQQGAKTRAAIMSVLYTVKKRHKNQAPEVWLKQALDSIVKNPKAELTEFLTYNANSPP